ncbi:unnamed protein product, partial [Oncorhynchus mykiss]
LQTRLDALTEVDDCGQLTIKCSQDYFSLDCGITAYELSDYSPSEDQEGTRGPGQGQDPRNEVSPTQPSLPKKPMYLEGEAETSLSLRRSTLPSSLQFQADLSRSTPSLLDPPDRSKFWLELDAVYPSNASQSYNSLHAMNDRNLQASRQSEAGRYQRQGDPAGAHIPLQRSSSEAGRGGHFPQDISPIPIPFSGTGECNRDMDDPQTVRDTNSPLLSPMRGPLDHESHDEASSEDSSPLKKAADWIIQRQGPKRHLQAQALAEASPNPSEERWFGSDEFLALPAS